MDQKALIHFYNQDKDLKRKSDSESEEEHQSKKKNSPSVLDHSLDHSSPPPAPKKSVNRFDLILLVWCPLPKQSENQLCYDCHQKYKLCHNTLFSPYANAFVTYHLHFPLLK